MGGIKRARNGGKMLQKGAPFQFLLVIPAGEGPLLPCALFCHAGVAFAPGWGGSFWVLLHDKNRQARVNCYLYFLKRI